MSTVAAPRGVRVSRELVHRANEEEILVSPPWRETGGYGSATVTTGISSYYRDHPGSYWLDALLLIEACRQAALSAAHEFEGLARDIAFFFNSIEVRLTDPQPPAAVDGELTLRTRFEQLRLRSDGTPKQITYTQTGADATGREVVHTSMAVQGSPRTATRSCAPTSARARPPRRRPPCGRTPAGGPA